MSSNSSDSELVSVLGMTTEMTDEVMGTRINEFRNILDSIAMLDEDRKFLMNHVYENALQDRKNAYSFLFELSKKAYLDPDILCLHGPTIAKFIERMSRANDQIIKLAEMIQEQRDKNETVSVDDVYEQIQQKG